MSAEKTTQTNQTNQYRKCVLVSSSYSGSVYSITLRLKSANAIFKVLTQLPIKAPIYLYS